MGASPQLAMFFLFFSLRFHIFGGLSWSWSSNKRISATERPSGDHRKSANKSGGNCNHAHTDTNVRSTGTGSIVAKRCWSTRLQQDGIISGRYSDVHSINLANQAIHCALSGGLENDKFDRDDSSRATGQFCVWHRIVQKWLNLREWLELENLSERQVF